MALSDFRQLLEYYDGELIGAATFMYRWFDIRKQERTWMGPAEDPLDQVFLALDDYVPDTGQERTEDAIDERQLREIVHRSLALISTIDDSETRRFDTTSDVVSGFTDIDPEIRSHSAVIAREFPGDPVVIDALRARLTDPDNPVRRMAVESLGQLGDVGSFDAILQTLESAVDPFSEASAVANLAVHEPRLRPRARAAITSWAKRQSSPSTERNLVIYLRLIGDDDD